MVWFERAAGAVGAAGAAGAAGAVVPDELLPPAELDGPVASFKSTMKVSMRVVHPNEVSDPSVPPQ